MRDDALHSTVTDPAGATLRPVTPHSILAALVVDLRARLGATALPDDVRRDLDRAAALAAGLDPYLDAHATPQSPAARALEAHTLAQDWPALHAAGETRFELESEMLCGPVEARTLQMLVQMSGARRVLEVGMFTGYSALAMAEVLPPDGRLVTLEIEPFLAAFARPFFERAGVADRVEVRVGAALDAMAALAEAGETFDLIFIDARKDEYGAYYERALDGLLAPGGWLVVDNALLQGHPWLPADQRSASGEAIAGFNAQVEADRRVEQVIVPLRDGLMLVRRA